MDDRTDRAGSGSRLAAGQGAGRPASRARRTASGGIHSPETAYRTLMDCAADVLGGALAAAEANAVRGVIVGAVVVARNADLMDDMQARCEAACDDGRDPARDAEVEELEARLAALRGGRLPQKG